MKLHILENEIHLWYTRHSTLLDDRIYHLYTSWLSTAETERLNNYQIASKKKGYLISRALLRSVFSRYYPINMPADWLFAENDYGKPYISNYPALSEKIEFNLSHSNDITILALTNNGSIGIDCECMCCDPFANDSALELFLSNEEIYYINKFEARERRLMLFKMWTLKEAFVKAIGVGMHLPLNSICLKSAKISEHMWLSGVDTIDYNNWQFIEAHAIEDYMISIVRRFTSNNSSYKIITREIIPSCASVELKVSETLFTVNNATFLHQFIKCW